MEINTKDIVRDEFINDFVNKKRIESIPSSSSFNFKKFQDQFRRSFSKYENIILVLREGKNSLLLFLQFRKVSRCLDQKLDTFLREILLPRSTRLEIPLFSNFKKFRRKNFPSTRNFLFLYSKKKKKQFQRRSKLDAIVYAMRDVT